MSLNKRDTMRAVARRTSLTYKQADEAVQALIDIWFEVLSSGGKIIIENFLVLEVKPMIGSDPNDTYDVSRTYSRVTARASRKLRLSLNQSGEAT